MWRFCQQNTDTGKYPGNDSVYTNKASNQYLITSFHFFVQTQYHAEYYNGCDACFSHYLSLEPPLSASECWENKRKEGYCSHKLALLPKFMFNAHQPFSLYPGVPARVRKAVHNGTRYNIPTRDGWRYFDNTKVAWKLSCFDHYELCY